MSDWHETHREMLELLSRWAKSESVPLAPAPAHAEAIDAALAYIKTLEYELGELLEAPITPNEATVLEIARLTKENENLRIENVRFAEHDSALRWIRTQRDQAEADLKSARAEIDRLTKKNEELQAEIDRLREERDYES